MAKENDTNSSGPLLPPDPNVKEPLIMGDPYDGKTPKTAQEKWIAEHSEGEEQGKFKYAASTIANHPDPWMKTSQVAGVNTMMTQPMWFSPLHTPQNWQIASKRREVYQWNRFWYDNEPKVAAAIDFYSRFPMNGFRLECPSKKILSFFEHYVVKRLKLNELFKMISSEYFMLGDVFVHLNVACPQCQGSGRDPDTGEKCDHKGGIFNRIIVLNPDWIEVQQSPLVDEPQIALNPDEELKNIVFYKQPKAIYDRIPDFIKELVIQGKPIPLSNRTTHHLKHMAVPYGTYGTSLTRRLFVTLAYKTKIMTANWIVAERLILPVRVVKVGNDNRPASSADIADIQQQLGATANDPNLTIVTHHAFEYEWYGACYSHDTEVLTENGWKLFSEIDRDEKVATYNQTTGELEYQLPTEYHEYDFHSTDTMKMHHFKSKQIDLLVTPNHRMLVNRNGRLREIYSQEVRHNDKLLSTCTWSGNLPDQYPHEDGPLSHLSLEEFLTFAGYYLSEGGLQIERHKGLAKDKQIRTCNIGQNRGSVAYAGMKAIVGKVYPNYSEREDSRGNDTYCSLVVNSTTIAKYMAVHFGSHAHNKRIPHWIKGLPTKYLKILYDAMMAGDGDVRLDRSTPRYRYTTTSKTLADDFSEVCLKLGFFSRTSKEDYVKISTHRPIYRIYLSERRKNTPFTLRNQHIRHEDYSGKVYCVKVPNSWLFVRRNGWINICGNTGRILQVTAELEWIGKEILDGYMLNQSLLNGEMCIPEYDRMLTKTGLKSLRQITPDDEIATFNKETGMLEYQKPSNIHVYDYDGDLMHFQTDRLDFACTPNHRMLFQKRGSSEWTVDVASKVRDRAKFKKNVEWWDAPEKTYPNLTIGDRSIPFKDVLKIIAYYVTEGHIQKETRKSRSTYGQPQSVQIAQTDKGKGWEDICELQSQTTAYRVCKTRHGCGIHNKDLARWISEECGQLSHNKRLPQWLKLCDKSTLKLLLNYMINGDGSIRTRDRGNDKQYYTYYTKSDKLRDDIVEISLKCGYFPRFRKRKTIWEVTFSDYDLGGESIPLESKKHDTITNLPYKGKVWCVTVPNSFIITERNGRLMISGNSGYQSAQVGVETLIRRIESWRHTLAEWCEEHIFKPIAQMQGFVDEEKSAELGETVHLYPTIKWNDLELKDKQQWYQLLTQLHDKQVISTQTLMEELHLNYDQEIKRMRYEQMQTGPGGAPMGGAGAGGMPMGGGAGGMGAAGGGAAAPGPGGDMGMGMGGPGMGGPGGGGDMGGMGGGGMGAAAGGQKVMKKGKGQDQQEQQQAPIAFVKLTQIEQKMAGMLEDVANANNLNPGLIRAQFPVENPKGGKRYQLDFAIPHIKLGVECLTPDTLVQTNDGSKFAQDVNIHDLLVGRNGDHVLIKNIILNQHNGDVIRIKPYGMLPFKVTPNHPFLVCKPIAKSVLRNETKRTRNRSIVVPGEPNFMKASEIKVGDYLAIPKGRAWPMSSISMSAYNGTAHNAHKLPDSLLLDKDLGWLLGIYVAEGSADPEKSSCIEFSFCEDEVNLIDNTQRILNSIFGLETNLIPSKQDRGVRLTTCSTALARFLTTLFGRGANHKKLPGWMRVTPNAFKQGFFEGYCSGDGCIREYDGSSRFISSSRKLVTDAQFLAISMGFWGSIVKSRDPQTMNILGRTHETAGLWELVVNFMGQTKKQYKEDSAFFYVPVKQVSSEHYMGVVFNFETSGEGDSNHTYCVGNVVTHNCDGEVWHSTSQQEISDKERDYLLAQRGWTILRFDDKVIDDAPHAVKQTINQYLHDLVNKKGKKSASVDRPEIHCFSSRGEKLTDFGDQYDKYFAGQSTYRSSQIGAREEFQNINYKNGAKQSEVFGQ
jgi:intein/homing endonuclease